ncbi:flagellin [Acidaminobacter sp. JC074]|uniref:flagellin n=1 Tax=Acidaminobacter sp. JC074 TaxID=2530199 RepID=UPI001F0F73C9|nr:flagellin [Acidaminobacter sp. JC074]
MKIQAYDVYSKIASGNRINSASDDPAGLAISEKLESQIKGDQQAIQNIESSQDLLNTADGSLQNVLTDLGRVRELTVQAGNGIFTDEDRAVIQNEINSLFENIQSNVQNTNFNTKKLVDGSFTNQQLGVGANGQGTQMTIRDASLEALGLDNFSVEDGVDKIDEAISRVTESLSEIGASTNGLESNLNNTRVSEINQAASQSGIRDLDIAKQVIELNKQNSLNQYKILLQNKQAEQAESRLGLLI